MSYWISKEDFGCVKEHCTYKIKCPGTYKLKENISFNPKKNRVAAILIDCDNVILDLNGKVLKQSSHNCKSQITGVVVKSGHRNVTILGSYGTVKDFSQRGVYVEGGNDLITIGDHTQLTVSGCGYGTERTFADRGEGVPQAGLQLGDQEYMAALKIGNFHGILNQLNVQNVVATGNNIGCILGEGSNYVFEGCSFSGNMENRLMWEDVVRVGNFYQPTSVITYGLVYGSNPEVTPAPNVGVNNVVFQDCKFNDNLADGVASDSEGAYSNGFIFTNNFRNLKVKNCQFNKNKSVLGSDGVFNETIGFVVGAGVGTVVEDSEFSANEGGSEVIGCSFSGYAPKLDQERTTAPSESTTVRNCVASRNLGRTGVTSLQDVNVRGFSLKFPSGATLIGCVSEDNKVLLTEDNKDSVFGFCNGIYIFSDPEDRETFTNNVELRGCKLSRNRVTSVGAAGSDGPSKGSSAGIRVFDDLCENILIRDCFISENRPDFDEPVNVGDFLTTGIDLFNQVTTEPGPSYVTICNNVIQSNGQVGIDNNLVYTNIQENKISNHQTAILLSGDNEGNFVNLCGNILENSFYLSESAVIDLNEPSTTLVASNKSYSTPCGYQVFYDGGVPPAITSSDLPAFPAVSPFALANIQINNPHCGACPEPVQKFDAKKYRAAKAKLLRR